MAEKKRSAISKVMLNTATFSNETFEPTYINLFFGRNGAGKSSVAYALEEGDGVQWKAGESPDNYDLLVYNQDFIDNNFESFDNLPGVFTVDKVNIQIQQRIDALGTEKIQVADEMAKLIEAGNKKKALKESLLTQLQNECWSRSADIRADFDATQSGKKRKNTFTEKVLSTTPVDHDLAELKELYDVAYDDNSQTYPSFKKSSDAFGRYE